MTLVNTWLEAVTYVSTPAKSASTENQKQTETLVTFQGLPITFAEWSSWVCFDTQILLKMNGANQQGTSKEIPNWDGM